MAATTSGINACDVVVRIDPDVGFLQDISGESNSVDINLETKVSDGVRVFGDPFPIRKACGKDASIKIRVVYSEDGAEAMHLFEGWYQDHYADTRTVQIDVPDSDVGSDRYTFECFLVRLPIPLKTDDPGIVMVEIDLLPTGTFSIAEISS